MYDISLDTDIVCVLMWLHVVVCASTYTYLVHRAFLFLLQYLNEQLGYSEERERVIYGVLLVQIFIKMHADVAYVYHTIYTAF